MLLLLQGLWKWGDQETFNEFKNCLWVLIGVDADGLLLEGRVKVIGWSVNLSNALKLIEPSI